MKGESKQQFSSVFLLLLLNLLLPILFCILLLLLRLVLIFIIISSSTSYPSYSSLSSQTHQPKPDSLIRDVATAPARDYPAIKGVSEITRRGEGRGDGKGGARGREGGGAKGKGRKFRGAKRCQGCLMVSFGTGYGVGGLEGDEEQGE